MSGHTYYSQYNKAEFDEPFYAGEPKQVLILASTPRVGSTLLLRGLMSIDAIAASTEFFNPVHRVDFEARWGTLSDKEYLEKLIQHRTKSNGLFAVKAHYNHFSLYEQYLKSFNLHFISIQRKDIVLQAVSWFKGELTESWSSEKVSRKNINESDYDFYAISSKVKEINELYQQWETYYSVNGHTPDRIFYEDIDKNYGDILHNIANNFLSMSISRNSILEPSLKKQRDALTKYYVSKFYNDHKQDKGDVKITRPWRIQAWMQKIFNVPLR
ncbi:Stf0 family sulfotransferase [Desulfobulbus sp.]|uniref:Stf0 family sulfotransferase n=1 Tax=Desulfobulbus sp. TaxID=895 RepID=UPI00286EEA14|nr:Stf0 family sulfotransferase [Desulfobulbus sp.]